MHKLKKCLGFGVLFSLVFLLVACGAANSDSNANQVMSGDSLQFTNYSLTSNTVAQDTKTTTTSTSVIQQMLIYKGDINIGTDHFDNTLEVVTQSLVAANGYIVSQEDRSGDYANRFTTLEVRIPSAQFFSWVEGLELLPDTKVTKHIYTEDVSEEYVDLKAREKAKQVVIDKYLEYMQLAETADELIRFTNELAALQEEIESVQARIRYLDNQVNYSTVTLFLRETKESAFLSELQIGSKIKNAFEDGFSGAITVFAFLISTIIVLIPFVLFGLCIWAIIYLITRSFSRRRVKRVSNSTLQSPVSSLNNEPNKQINKENNEEQSNP